jgi:putative phage-type endonuclease
MKEAREDSEVEVSSHDGGARGCAEGIPDYITCPECRLAGRDGGPVVQLIRRDLEVCKLQKDSEWLRKRRKCITSTDVASIIGQNPYSDRTDVLYKKLKLDSFQGNEATRWGEANEDAAIEELERRTGCLVSTFGLLKISESHSRKLGGLQLAGSPDGILACGRAIVEVKCPFRRKIQPGVIPKYYLPQIQTVMELLREYRVSRCFFVQYDPRPSPKIFDLTVKGFDPTFIPEWSEALRKFQNTWKDCESGKIEIPQRSVKRARWGGGRGSGGMRGADFTHHSGVFDFII